MSRKRTGAPMGPPSARLLAAEGGGCVAPDTPGISPPRARVLALNRQMAAADVATRVRLSPEMDEALRAAPGFAEAMQPHALAMSLTLNHYGKTQPMMEGAATIKLGEVRASLGYETAPPLERLLIEQVALCWLRQGEAELMYSQIMSKAHQPAESAYAERRLSACMSRYVRACESLARVRRLSKGVAVQVNVANQQIVTG